MLTHPTLEKLQALRLSGMVKGLEEQLPMTDLDESRLRGAPGPAGGPRDDGAREPPAEGPAAPRRDCARARRLEDVDFRTPRGLDRSLFLSLARASGSPSISTS